MYVDELHSHSINGKMQFLSIRGEKHGAPLLLYLHGGPGDAALPQMLKYNKALEAYYTVVVWEQRGAGLSYYPFEKDENISIQTFVEDARTIILYILERFQEHKVYLLAHSWGTVIGLQLIQQYPDLVHAYIGCGQVVHMEKSCKHQCNFLSDKFHGNPKLMQALNSVDCTFDSDHWLKDLMFVTRSVVKNKGSVYGKTSNLQYYLDFLFCKKYNLRSLLNRIKGSDQSIMYLWKELMKTNFEATLDFQVPVVFMEGRHDHHVSSELVESYFASIRTDKKLYWFEQSGHYPHWEEPVKFNQLMKDLLADS